MHSVSETRNPKVQSHTSIPGKSHRQSALSLGSENTQKLIPSMQSFQNQNPKSQCSYFPWVSWWAGDFSALGFFRACTPCLGKAFGGVIASVNTSVGLPISRHWSVLRCFVGACGGAIAFLRVCLCLFSAHDKTLTVYPRHGVIPCMLKP